MTVQPWPRKSMLLTAPFMYATIALGGYLLWDKSLIFFGIYMATWIGILTIGRHFVCRPCPHYGEDCPTGFGHIVRMYPKDTTREFSGKACITDVLAIEVALFIPIVIWILSFVNIVDDFNTLEHVLMAVYLVLFSSFSTAHTVYGCNKCQQENCPASGVSRERKKKAKKLI